MNSEVCCGEPKRVTPEILRLIADLAESVTKYGNIFERLEGRLNYVTAPLCPEPEDKAVETQCRTALAQDLHEINKKISHINEDMENLYKRIDL